MMRSEIIAVGSELAGGATLDTNGPWLSRELARLGIPTRLISTVSDDLDAIVDLLRGAAQRAELVILTGGLGPTLDDVTRQAVAECAAVPLELNPRSLAEIQQRFDRLGRTMTERNRTQAFLPAGGRAISNPRGTAPGIWMTLPRGDKTDCTIIALPGVPSEMRPMFLEEVRPNLPRNNGVIQNYRLHVFGLGESAVEERLGDLTARGNIPDVGITAHEGAVTLRIVARGESPVDCDAQAAPIKETIRERLGDFVVGEDDQHLQDVVVDLLRRRRETLAVVETSLSGGRLTDWLTAVPGVDQVFRGGLTAISLDIGLDSPDKMKADSDEDGRPARMLAEAYRASFKATWGLAIVAIPDETGDVSEGTIAVVGADCVATASYTSGGNAAVDRSRSAKTALDLLRRRLLKVQ